MFKNNKIKIFMVVSIFLCSVYPKEVTARPISNTFKASISVIGTDVSVGAGEEFDYNEINEAISNVKIGGVVRIKSGEYRIESILGKDVTLESYDGGYVDIITTSPIPQDIKLKVGNKVTVNQAGVAPINIVAGIIEPDTTPVLSNNEITVQAKQGDVVQIRLNEHIVNKLGFNDVNIMLRTNRLSGINIEKTYGTGNIITPQVDGVYNLGKSQANYMALKITFTRGGDYTLELWADDGR